ncbi:DUF1307 domain-containing protein [Isobaculum melis]|uniref:Uncharacterized lipoprotein YehR, DUF1307 family n=1 Tax=Isobaculum melis TaxID=142588 RepID=A0A1H9PY55_9LACT|nr:DUF1307 domain-containing protein [Isobaculum melis]SER53137.1 Uncharacterized lipoprotein YehR, DUF1307 family [Isobaculum melis]
MKKLSKTLLQIGLVAVLALVLTACGKKQSVTYEKEESGIEMEMTLHAKGDKVYEQIIKTSMPYEMFGISDKEEAKEQFDEVFEEYEEITGVEREIAYSNDKVSLSYTIDLKKVDFDKVEEQLGAEYEDNAKKNGVSFKATSENLEEDGWTKK